MKSVPAPLLLAMLCALLVVSGGCGLLGTGSDDSRLTIKNKGCEVDVSQHGKIAGLAGTTFSEDIKIDPDCTVTIVVKDAVHGEKLGEPESVVESDEETETTTKKAEDETSSPPQTD